MAEFRSDHAFLTVWVGNKKIQFTNGFAQTDDEEIIKALEQNHRVTRIDKPEEKEEEKNEEAKPKAKSTKKTTKKKAEK